MWWHMEILSVEWSKVGRWMAWSCWYTGRSVCWFKWGVRWCGLRMEFCVVGWMSQMFCRRDWQVSLRFSRWIG